MAEASAHSLQPRPVVGPPSTHLAVFRGVVEQRETAKTEQPDTGVRRTSAPLARLGMRALGLAWNVASGGADGPELIAGDG
jgi:hypothetical protein